MSAHLDYSIVCTLLPIISKYIGAVYVIHLMFEPVLFQ